MEPADTVLWEVASTPLVANDSRVCDIELPEGRYRVVVINDSNLPGAGHGLACSIRVQGAGGLSSREVRALAAKEWGSDDGGLSSPSSSPSSGAASPGTAGWSSDSGAEELWAAAILARGGGVGRGGEGSDGEELGSSGSEDAPLWGPRAAGWQGRGSEGGGSSDLGTASSSLASFESEPASGRDRRRRRRHRQPRRSACSARRERQAALEGARLAAAAGAARGGGEEAQPPGGGLRGLGTDMAPPVMVARPEWSEDFQVYPGEAPASVRVEVQSLVGAGVMAVTARLLQRGGSAGPSPGGGGGGSSSREGAGHMWGIRAEPFCRGHERCYRFSVPAGSYLLAVEGGGGGGKRATGLDVTAVVGGAAGQQVPHFPAAGAGAEAGWGRLFEVPEGQAPAQVELHIVSRARVGVLRVSASVCAVPREAVAEAARGGRGGARRPSPPRQGTANTARPAPRSAAPPPAQGVALIADVPCPPGGEMRPPRPRRRGPA